MIWQNYLLGSLCEIYSDQNYLEIYFYLVRSELEAKEVVGISLGL
jgi:hypothetical protein